MIFSLTRTLRQDAGNGSYDGSAFFSSIFFFLFLCLAPSRERKLRYEMHTGPDSPSFLPSSEISDRAVTNPHQERPRTSSPVSSFPSLLMISVIGELRRFPEM